MMTRPTDTDRSGGDPAYYEALGRAIRVLRTERGLARKDLAEAAGISYPYLSEIETGKKRPSSKALFAVAEALEVRPAELLALSDRYGGRTSVEGSPLPIASTLSPTPPRSIPSRPIPPESVAAPASFEPPPPAAAAASGSAGSAGQRWRWFERRAGAPAEEAASAGTAPAMAARAAAAPEQLRTGIGAPGDDERRRLLDELGEAAERLSDDDLAALLDLARRLGR